MRAKHAALAELQIDKSTELQRFPRSCLLGPRRIRASVD